MPPIQRFCLQATAAPVFQRVVLGLIVFAGILVGLETHAPLVARAAPLFRTLDALVLALFTVELALRIGAHGARPWRFFADAWNVFDFVIVAVCLLPFPTHFAAVLRLARVLRVLRLVTAVPRLQILVGALLKSIPSMSYVALLLCLLFYIYAVIGVTLFGAHDPAHFGSLPAAALTLFQVVTLEGWADILRDQLDGGAAPTAAVAYFVSFILLGTMIVLNLLIGVIVNGMDEARRETEDAARDRHVATLGATTAADDLVALERQAQALQESLAALRRRLKP